MSYKLTTNGGLKLGSFRSIELVQAQLLIYNGKLDLFVRENDNPKWVLHFPKTGAPVLTEHGTVRDQERDFIPGWIYPLTNALARVTTPSKEPSHD